MTMSCTDGKVTACGWCGRKFKRTGYRKRHEAACDPAVKPAQFWSKVEKRDGDQCWGWKAQTRWDGYGRFVNLRRPIFAHRYSYELHHGPIPAGMHVLHKCDTPSCTNPAHLRLGTHSENMEDMKAKGRHPNGEKAHWAKLTDEKVREFRRDLIAPVKGRRGVSNLKELAARYDVSVSALDAVRRGITWKHVK